MDAFTTYPTLIAHADWSTHPRKRWLVAARRQRNGQWLVAVPVQAVDATRLLESIRTAIGDEGTALVGFDFPIGLPRAYAQRCGITDFLSTLTLLGAGVWSEFFQPAVERGQISLYRPFYPNKPGEAKRDHLSDGLGIPFNDLYRLCERAHTGRKPACPLFWTLGGQQVGKAAINGWQSVLQAGLLNSDIKLSVWPFSGELRALLQPGNIVAVETYPAEFNSQLAIDISTQRQANPGGKRSQPNRQKYASLLLSLCDHYSILLGAKIENLVLDGFGSKRSGEDQFDALVGLIGMVKAIKEWRIDKEPQANHLRKIEGWIFGQETGIKYGPELDLL